MAEPHTCSVRERRHRTDLLARNAALYLAASVCVKLLLLLLPSNAALYNTTFSVSGAIELIYYTCYAQTRHCRILRVVLVAQEKLYNILATLTRSNVEYCVKL